MLRWRGRVAAVGQDRQGLLLVFAAALTWSFGGVIARGIETADSWSMVGWRSCFASLFLLGWMLLREGWRGSVRLFASMGLAGIAVGLCFATASTSFVVALSHTTVANILLMQAGAPLVAALMAWALFQEKVPAATWAAIAAVIAGVAVMLSTSISDQVSLQGNALALLTMLGFTCAVLITRRFNHVQMMPAVCFGMASSTIVGALLSTSMRVDARDLGLLIVFGALNLGLGMAFFVSGARTIAASIAALISTLETVLGPIWVWLIHGELPGERTLIGGSIVFAALFGHLLWQWRQRREEIAVPMAD